MDIELISMAFSQGQVQQQAFMSVMKMAMGKVEQQGQVVQKLMSTNEAAIQNTAQPYWDGNFDL